MIINFNKKSVIILSIILIVLLTVIFFFSIKSFAQGDLQDIEKIGTLSINNTGTDSILIKLCSRIIVQNDGCFFTGSWGLNIYPQRIGGTTNGSIRLYTKEGDWLGNVEDADSLEVDNNWFWNHMKFRSYNISEYKPIFAKWLYIERKTGDGIGKFHIYQTWKTWKK